MMSAHLPTFASIRRASPSLTAVGTLMAALLVAFVGTMVFDRRVVLGAPLWLKPAKFAASTSLYSFTVAWVLTYLEPWRRLRRAVGGIIAVVFVIEVALIVLQAARGTTSHFNVGTPFDAAIFGVMGVAILLATLAAVALAVATFRQPFEDPAIGWAIRFGLVISLMGSIVGGVMTRPSPAQLDEARAAGRLTVAGAHTVGAPDGGAGIPGTGWSREHGDLRVPHFVGLHALQVLPLVAILAGSLAARRRQRVVFIASLSYAVLLAIFFSEALAGRSILMPGAATFRALVVWAFATTVGVVLVLFGGDSRQPNAR